MPETFINDVLLPTLYSILSVLIPVVAGFVIDAVRKWGARQKAEWVRSLLQEAADAAERAVSMVEQTFARNRRDENGKLTAESAREAFGKSMIAATNQLGVEGMSSLKRIAGSDVAVDDLLGTMIESAIDRRKNPRSASEFTGG